MAVCAWSYACGNVKVKSERQVQVMYSERYGSMKELDSRMCSQLDFIMEIDKLKNIVRQSYISDGSRKETDTDHSWSLAMMCILLSEYANEKIDVLKTVKMVLIHDIVEIDAGDTYAYDTNGNDTKRERELKAAERIFNILPKEQGEKLRGLWDEFEERKTAEAKFANTLDKIQPVMLNDITGGRAWREHNVREEQIMGRNSTTHEGSEKLWEFCKKLIEENIIMGNIEKSKK